MSLPKEPRQKMINIMYLVLTALLALNVSSEILNAFRTVNRSLENTNTTVNRSTETIMNSLKEKTTKPETAERANKWLPKADSVVMFSKNVYDYITSLKAQILEKAGGSISDPTKEFKEDNLDIVTKLMVQGGEGKKLLKMLGDYKANVLGINPDIKTEFENSLQIDLSNPPGRDGKTKDWDISYFSMVPTVAGLTILSKFQNDIKTAENKVVAFCHNKVGSVEVVFDSYSAIVGQSSNYLMPGQKLEIKAGVGAFSKSAKPIITIGGSPVELGEEGFAMKEFVAEGIGARKIPVTIEYFNQTTGQKEIKKVDVEYEVGSSNASIALDKMNVLYIGVDNPVTIAASGAGDDKVNVSISGGAGSISRVGKGKYNVRVNQQSDDCKISVTVDGKVAGVSQFRVREIPGAQATVGTYVSGENIPAASFRAQGGVAAWIKDFPFDLKYRVTQFTFSTDSDDGTIVEATCTGNAFSANAQNLIKQYVKPGATVYIDNIRVEGEDGKNKKVGSLVYYIK